MSLSHRIASEIATTGPIRFDAWMHRCLYDTDGGFYQQVGMAGRSRGDFITSPEVGPLFGAVIARAIDTWWVEAGSPNRFVVAEAAAGVGTLARTVLSSQLACAAALEWVAVETSAALRSAHGDLLAAGHRSQNELPENADVVIANELLDNLATRLVQRSSDGWLEVGVALSADEQSFVRHLSPVTANLPDAVLAVADAVPVGAVIAVADAGVDWVKRARAVSGRLLIFDYGPPTLDPSGALPVRTYRQHDRGADPLVSPGTVDITYDVPFDQLPTPTVDMTQAQWLQQHGINELVEAGRAEWAAQAAVGGLAALRARSRVVEASALLDPLGLGGFRALEWD